MHSVDLGGFIIDHPSSRLRLHGSTIVDLAINKELDQDAVHEDTPTLHDLQSSWISASSGIYVRFDVRWDGHPVQNLPFMENLVERLICSIKNSQAWKNLDISIEAALTDSRTVTGNELLFIARRDADSDILQSKRCHNLPVEIETRYLEPPPEVEHYHLLAVAFLIHIQSTPDQPENASQALSGYNEVNDLHTPPELIEPSSFGLDCFSKDYARDQPFPNACEYEATERPWASQFLALVNLSFRFSLCAWPQGLKREYKLQKDNRQSTLSKLVPSLWARGYSQSVAERACFLSTIARALDHFQDTSIASTVKKSLTSTDASLWKLLQQRSLNSRAGIRLSLLEPDDIHTSSSLHNAFSVVDTEPEKLRDADRLGVNMLDGSSEEGNGSESDWWGDDPFRSGPIDSWTQGNAHLDDIANEDTSDAIPYRYEQTEEEVQDPTIGDLGLRNSPTHIATEVFNQISLEIDLLDGNFAGEEDMCHEKDADYAEHDTAVFSESGLSDELADFPPSHETENDLFMNSPSQSLQSPCSPTEQVRNLDWNWDDFADLEEANGHDGWEPEQDIGHFEEF